jgi:hypothetical protein
VSFFFLHPDQLLCEPPILGDARLQRIHHAVERGKSRQTRAAGER